MGVWLYSYMNGEMVEWMDEWFGGCIVGWVGRLGG